MDTKLSLRELRYLFGVSIVTSIDAHHPEIAESLIEKKMIVEKDGKHYLTISGGNVVMQLDKIRAEMVKKT